MKKFTKRVSLFITLTMLASCVPVQAIAKDYNPDPVVNTVTGIVSDGSPAKIVKEITEKREKNVKQFLRDDGTYEAVVYSNPVHYMDNGVLKDIDNSLSEVSDDSGQGNKVLSTKENDYNVKIDENANSKKLVSIKKDKYEVEWNVDKANSANVNVTPLDEKRINDEIDKDVNVTLQKDSKIKDKAKAKAILTDNEKKKTLKNISSEVTFNNIFNNVDLQYIVNSDKVKENIIINKAGSTGAFSFNFKVKNLTPEIQKDNSIIFYDSADTKKAVFKMQAPFMTDANKVNSSSIAVSLEQNKDGYKLTLTPDSTWLNDSSRAYPCIIDPPISTSLDVNAIHDSFISQSLPNNNYYTAVVLGVGNGAASGVTRSFIKFDLPSITSGSIVTSAQLRMALYTTNTTTRQINVCKVNGNWDSSTLTWNNAPSFNPIVQEYQLVNGAANSYWNYDVTSIVKDWYNTGNNYGLMLKSNDETAGYNEFYSSDCSSAYAAYRPQITLNYINNSGLESYWTFHSQSVNRAGTGYINDYTGNLVFIHDDLSMNGSKMPVNIKHVYNSNDRSAGNNGYGNGWRLNLNQRITCENINGTNYYCYTDDDGTKHYFFYDSASSTYKDETGLNITMTINSDGTYTVKDKGGNQLLFTNGGYLSKIVDNNGNTDTLTYNGTTLTQITDGAGRTTTFDIVPGGNLLGITDPSGRRTSFAYNGSNLQTITYPDGKQTTYNYDGNNNLTNAVNYDGYKVTYTYNGGSAQRIIKALESHTDGTLGGETNIAYGNNLTTFTDEKGRKDTFQFNNSGNTVSTRDSQGNADYTQYNEQTNDPNKNKALLSSKPQKTTVNYLNNSSAEYDTDWSLGIDAPSTGSGGFTTADKYIGSRSLTVTKTNTTNRNYMQQSLTLEKGKTYTYSGYIKTSGVSNSSGQGAHLLVHYKNNAGTWLETYSNYVSGTTDWTRCEVTFTIPSDASSADVILRTAIANETGTAYFDCLQLEDGSVTNRYNLIENGDFRNGSFTNWVKNADCDANDTLVYVDSSTDPNYTSANIDRNCFKINGVSGKNKNVCQTVNVSGNSGDTFVISGWAKADSVPLSSGRFFALDVGVKGNDGTWQWITIPFNQDSSDWQYLSSVIKTDRAYQSINVYGMYYNNANTAYFDGFRLYKEEFGESYTYDSNGNLASVKDIAKQNSSFAYNSTNDLIKSTDPKGNNFNYEYDSKHNVTKGTSAENVIYSFTYDSNGNPLTSKVGDSTLFINSSATYTSSGNYVNSITDNSGNTVTNNWNETKGLLNSVTDANNKTTSYTYDNNTDNLLSVSKNVDGQQITNSYSYLNDRLSSITHNGFSYNFGFDSLGNNTTVSVGNQNLITNSYEARTSKLLQSTYGNGQTVSNDYDNLDRVIAKKYNGNARYTYEYDASGNIGYQKDLINNVSYRYTYDIIDRLVKMANSLGEVTSYNYDTANNISNVTEKIGGSTYNTGYSFDKDNRQAAVNLNNGTNVTYSYDRLGRLNGSTINTSSGISGSFSTVDSVTGNTANSITKNISFTGRYIKLNLTKPTQAGSDNYVRIPELELYTNPISVIGKTVYANSYTNSNEVPQNAVDGSSTTKWCSPASTDAKGANCWWLTIDLGQAMDIGKWTVKHAGVGGETTSYNTQDFKLQVSNDNANFTDVDSVTGNTANVTERYVKTNGRYVRLYITKASQIDNYARIYEFSVDGINVALNKTAYSGGENSGGENANYMVDGQMNTHWCVSSSVTNWAVVDLGNTYTINKYVLRNAGDAGEAASYNTSDYTLQTATNVIGTKYEYEGKDKVSKLYLPNNAAISYSYDPNGNIKTITQNNQVITYTYNELNEVIREDNQVLNQSIVYSYDAGGNITSKVQYPYTTGSLGTATSTINYGYGDTNWKDKLTSYNGQNITYDAIGNPLTYNGWTYSWEEGRQLSAMSGNGNTISYKYNDSGIRTSKTVNGVTTNYHLVGDKVTYETNGTDKIYYTYDSTDNLVSMNLNGTEYYYIKNAQGDIIGLVDNTGSQVVSYSYDTWGKLISTTGSLASTVGAKNPYRYRGYRYDTETGLYYLQSRYYNSEWGRFINADTIENGEVGTLLSYNLYAYCMNNPINDEDPNGTWSISSVWKSVKSAASSVVNTITKHAVATVATVVIVATAILGTNYILKHPGTARVISGGATAIASKYIGDEEKLFDDCEGHIFSSKHVAEGIMKLGTSRQNIFNKFINIVKTAERNHPFIEGSNNIQTTINGIKVTVTFFIQKGKIINMDGFVGWSARQVKNLIRM